MCKQQLSLDCFNKKTSKLDGLQPYCKPCNSIKCKKYYSDNKEKHLKVIKKLKAKSTAKKRKYLLEYLLKNPCIDCGEKNVLVLEFDHRENKINDISGMIRGENGYASMVSEIKKCDVRCANCHRAKTHKEQNSYRWQFVSKMRS